MTKPIDVLLVHGSWHGGWAWDGIAESLRTRGHRVLAPDLLGLGKDAPNLAEHMGLYAHADQLAALVQSKNLDSFVLVGHSYGGAIVHLLEGRIADRLHAVVHVEGAIPSPGCAVIELWEEERMNTALKAVAERTDGWRVPPVDPKSWGGLSAEQIAWLLPKLTDQSLRTYQEIMPIDRREADCPHYYLFAEDRVPHPYTDVIEGFRGAPNWRIAATLGGHELMFTNPEVVLTTIETAIEGGSLPERL